MVKGSTCQPERQQQADDLQCSLQDFISILQCQGFGNGDALQHINEADDDSIAQLLAHLRYGRPPANSAPWQALGNVAHHANGGGADLVLVRRWALQLEDVDDGNPQHCDSDGSQGAKVSQPPAWNNFTLECVHLHPMTCENGQNVCGLLRACKVTSNSLSCQQQPRSLSSHVLITGFHTGLGG